MYGLSIFNNVTSPFAINANLGMGYLNRLQKMTLAPVVGDPYIPVSSRGGQTYEYGAPNIPNPNNRYFTGQEYTYNKGVDGERLDQGLAQPQQQFYEDLYDKQMNHIYESSWDVRQMRSGNDRLRGTGTAGTIDLQPQIFPEIRRIGHVNPARQLRTAPKNLPLDLQKKRKAEGEIYGSEENRRRTPKLLSSDKQIMGEIVSGKL